jgi:protein-S-isoprenylcysteine O-methyltransferase
MYVWLYLAPPIVPLATIRPEAGAFTIGMILLLAGIALRVWSFAALGRYFTRCVQVSPGQPVVTNGPYRLVRHPGYAGGLLAWVGIGVTSANWAGLAAVTLLPLIVVIWLIHLEEHALLATLDDDRYRRYAAQHKRLIPGCGERAQAAAAVPGAWARSGASCD